MTGGLLLTLAFPLAGQPWIAFFALIPWVFSIPTSTPGQAFAGGFWAGIVHFTTLIYWIVPTLHVYGGLHPVLAASTLALLCVYLALYPALFAFLMNLARPRPVLAPFMAACLWTGLEYIRTYAFTGFSWGSLGYSQYGQPLLIQIADLTGVYGLSFLIVLINYGWVDLYRVFRKQQTQPAWPALAAIVLLSVAALTYGHFRLSTITSLISSADKPMLTVVQGNIQQDVKWDEAFTNRTIDKYTDLSRAAAVLRPDLVIWPETALPFYYGHDRTLSEKVDRCVKETGAYFLIGSPAFRPDGEATLYFNRAYMLNPFALVTGSYDKHHLVPFGEYVPFGQYLTFLGKLTAQAGNFSSGGKAFAPLAFKNHRTGVLICFEILFPHIASRFVRNGADLLVTLTNDAWFGTTSAPMQHFSIAVFRAVESRRTIARAANTGISGFIDPTGKIFEATPLFTDTSVTRPMPALTLITWYTRFGDMFAIGSMVAFCLCFMVKVIRTHLRRHEK